MGEFLKIILESNTFNFLVFAVILGLILRKIKIGNIISNMQKDIEKDVTKSNDAKENSITELNAAKTKMDNVETDIEKIISEANNSGDLMAKKIVDQADSQIEIIGKNAKKTIENDIQKTKKKLSDKVVKEAVNLTEKKIKSKIAEIPELNQRYIIEAIDELEGINL